MLPHFADVLAACLTREFSARADIEQQADALFVKLVERRCMSLEALVARHEQGLASCHVGNGRSSPTEVEVTDIM